MELFKDGFDTSNPLTLKWDTSSNVTIVTGAFGLGKGMSGNNGNATKTLASNLVTGWHSFHFNPGNLGAGIIAQWMDAGNNQLELQMDATGALFFTRNGTTIGSVSSTRLLANTTVWISAKGTIDPSSGEASVKVNGTAYLTQTGLNTRNTANSFFNQIKIRTSNNTQLIDNYHFNDSSGSFNNSYYSEVAINTLLANAAGSNAAWTRGGTNTGANFSQTNEAPEDGDTTYNASSTPGQIDSFKFPALAAVSGVVTSVALNTVARKDDANPRTFEHYVKSPNTTGTVAVSSAFAPGGTYTGQQSIWETDPNTGIAWAIAAVSGSSGAEYGYECLT